MARQYISFNSRILHSVAGSLYSLGKWGQTEEIEINVSVSCSLEHMLTEWNGRWKHPHEWMFSLSPYPQLSALSWIHVKLHVFRIQGCFITLPVFFVAMWVLESKARPWIQISGSHRFWKMIKFGQHPLGFILCQFFFFFFAGRCSLKLSPNLSYLPVLISAKSWQSSGLKQQGSHILLARFIWE